MPTSAAACSVVIHATCLPMASTLAGFDRASSLAAKRSPNTPTRPVTVTNGVDPSRWTWCPLGARRAQAHDGCSPRSRERIPLGSTGQQPERGRDGRRDQGQRRGRPDRIGRWCQAAGHRRGRTRRPPSALPIDATPSALGSPRAAGSAVGRPDAAPGPSGTDRRARPDHDRRSVRLGLPGCHLGGVAARGRRCLRRVARGTARGRRHDARAEVPTDRRTRAGGTTLVRRPFGRRSHLRGRWARVPLPADRSDRGVSPLSGRTAPRPRSRQGPRP